MNFKNKLNEVLGKADERAVRLMTARMNLQTRMHYAPPVEMKALGRAKAKLEKLLKEYPKEDFDMAYKEYVRRHPKSQEGPIRQDPPPKRKRRNVN